MNDVKAAIKVIHFSVELLKFKKKIYLEPRFRLIKTDKLRSCDL